MQDVTSLFVDRNLNGCQNYSLTPLIFLAINAIESLLTNHFTDQLKDHFKSTVT